MAGLVAGKIRILNNKPLHLNNCLELINVMNRRGFLHAKHNNNIAPIWVEKVTDITQNAQKMPKNVEGVHIYVSH